jgi:hypothetical protein
MILIISENEVDTMSRSRDIVSTRIDGGGGDIGGGQTEYTSLCRA